MASIENQLEAEGVQLIWVLEADRSQVPGTAQSCRDFVESRGSTSGICVGDSQTEPVAGTFDRSPFSVGRGFDMLVTRDDMRVVFHASHGSPGGNDNLSGEEIMAQIRAALGR